MEKKRPFAGVVINGSPVTTTDAKKAGLIKKSCVEIQEEKEKAENQKKITKPSHKMRNYSKRKADLDLQMRMLEEQSYHLGLYTEEVTTTI